MYSDDLAATLTSKYAEASDIWVFWEVPYQYDNGVCAKYEYSGKGGKAYRTQTLGYLYG